MVPAMAALLLGGAGCRVNADCFGSNECAAGEVCVRGVCQPPDWIPEDAGPADSGAVPPDAGPRVPMWWPEVYTIVERRCMSCHSQPLRDGVPMALASWSDTQVPTAFAGAPMHQRMVARARDPFAPMPPVGLASLSPREIELLEAWSEAGAPMGNPADAPRDGGVIMPRDAGPPDSGVDGGVTPVDGGVIADAGPGNPDAMVPDANVRPDAGSPVDGGPLADAGFPAGPMPAEPNPVVLAGVPQILAGGFMTLESPVYWPGIDLILFSDIPASIIYSIDPNQGGAIPYRQPSGGANGLAFGPDGDLYSCEHGGRRVSREENAVVSPLVTEYLTYALNSPNDLVVRSDGTIYFTDPPYGLAGRPRELPFDGVFRVDLDGVAHLEWAAPGTGPNGVALSPDETLLYVSEVETQAVFVFDVAPDGSLSNRRPFAATLGVVPDGMVTDDDGNLYVASAFGIEVFAPNGYAWGRIATPPSSNLTFAGADGLLLIVTTATQLYQLPVGIPGRTRQ